MRFRGDVVQSIVIMMHNIIIFKSINKKIILLELTYIVSKFCNMKNKPIIGITMGDFNGVGPEVTLKAINSPIIQKICSPVLIGSIDVYEREAKLLRKKILFQEVEIPSRKSQPSQMEVITIDPFRVPKQKIGALSAEAGMFAGRAIEKGVELWKERRIDAIVTAPVSKEAMKKAGYTFPGQTEMVAKLSIGKKFMMMLLAKSFRVGLATIHVPLKRVPELITKKLLLEKISTLHTSLKNDFAIASPCIALLGLNPHAGENGQIGEEENKVIIPATRQAIKKGMCVDGPFPADGFFGKHLQNNYDAILAMYHDQGLIPLKMQGFDIGVNVTIGLPIVRTSPDHGTAFDIAGKGIANESSMIEAIKLAVEIVTNRKKNI